MHRPYRHFDQITQAQREKASLRRAGRRRQERIGFLDLPVEICLDIYRNLLHPRDESYLNGEFEHEPCQPFGFETALLRVSKQVSNEAKLVFYGENIYVTVLYAADVMYGYDTVARDRDRRNAALPFMRVTHLHLVMAGEMLFGGHEDVVSYIRTSVAALSEEFAKAPKLKCLTVSFRDDLRRLSWNPDGLEVLDAGDDEADLQDMSYSLGHVFGTLVDLPNTITLAVGGVSVLDKTDDDDGIQQEVLEASFRSGLDEIMASRA